eukprot:TRINITY_DN12570_c0_g1_i1.p1 TRINITY_DN12570_c0_g1~~TRINITY_DN12570_c0_g1_i1.p1  ORF type:complete len:231 (-),score=51.23 TRINITY_DN12570_c0_g1_i1:18-710(-)
MGDAAADLAEAPVAASAGECVAATLDTREAATKPSPTTQGPPSLFGPPMPLFAPKPNEIKGDKLHVGGKEVRAGWKIMDAISGPHVDFVGNLADLGRFADASFDEIYASHVLEHVPLPQVNPTLVGLRRVLRPGGRFLVSVPDMDILCRFYMSPHLTLEQRVHVMRMMFGGQLDAHDFHHVGWNAELLQFLFKEAGFSSVEVVEGFGLFDDTSNCTLLGVRISLNAVVTK